MKTVNTIELKTHANRLLRRVAELGVILITKRGRPCAAIIPVSDETLAEVLWEHSPRIQKRLRKASAELHANKTMPLKKFAQRHGLA